MWMFPRNIRRIEPWKIVQIAVLLQAADGSAGTQELQDALYEELGRLGVKRPRSKDGTGVDNPGGLRTYLAQLACLGLFYIDQNGRYSPTYAGEQMIEGRNPAGVLRCQLLRLQYPSVYGWGQNVLVSPKVRVKPFAFLIRLLQDERLGGEIDRADAAVCVVYGRTRADYEKCVEKILQFRASGSETIRPVIDCLEDLCTPKRWDKEDDELWELGITDANQIANTALNYLTAAGLVETDRRGLRLYYRLTTDEKALADIRRWMKEEAKLEEVPDDPDRWIHAQNRFGRYDKTKVMSVSGKEFANGFANLIRASYVSAVEMAPYAFDHGAFVRDSAVRWNKSETEIEKHVSDLKKRAPDISRTRLVNAANSGGAEAIALETGMTNVFKILGFDRAEHIGQKKSPAGRAGGYPDIYLRASSENSSGMADTKATSKYGFPLSDVQKLGTYYHDAWKEIDPNSPSEFFLYVAGSFARSENALARSLADCTRQYGAPVSAVTVYALLDLADNSERPTAFQLMQVFRTSRYFNSDAQIIDAARSLK